MAQIVRKGPLPRIDLQKSDPRATDELFAEAIRESEREADSDFSPDPKKDGAFSPVAILHARGTHDVLVGARRLCGSPDTLRRRLGALVLGQLGSPKRSFPEECCDELLRLLATDSALEVIIESLFALGHLGNRRADLAVTKFSDSENKDIRHGVAFALFGTTLPEGISTLLTLINDDGVKARSWATSGIARNKALDGPDVREALLERVRDEDREIRSEAIWGLAVRKDLNVIESLAQELRTPSRLHYNFVDAAKAYLGLSEDEEISTPEILNMLSLN